MGERGMDGRIAVVTGAAGGIGGATVVDNARPAGGAGAWDPAPLDARRAARHGKSS